MSDILNLINDAIFVSLVNTTLQITLLIPVIAIIIWVFRIKSATTRYSLWLFALLAMIALPLLTPFVSQIDFARLHHQGGAGGGPDAMMRPGMGASDVGELARTDVSAPSTSAAKIAANKESDVSLINPVSVAYFIWCAGALSMFCITIGVYRKLGKLKIDSSDVESQAALKILSRLRDKLGIRRTVALKTSPEVHIPMSMGIFSPVIIVPDNVIDNSASDELEMILAHELAHIKRFDYLTRLLQNMLKVIFFFHPLFHLMKQKLAREREHICDDWVIDVTNRRSKYAECIIGLLEKTLHEPVNIPVALAMTERKRDIPGRVDMIVDRTRETVTKVPRKALFALLLIGCLSLPVLGGIGLVRFAGARAEDRGKIVFSSDRDGEWDLYLMDPDGSNVRRLTHGAVASDPCWSPDGSKIAFTSIRDGGREIYVVDSDGTNMKRLTDVPSQRGSRSPSWSPDGKKISFASDRVHPGAIFVMDADGKNPEVLIDLPGWNWFRAPWSPDGEKIAFSNDRLSNGKYALWVMNANGTNEELLIDLLGEDVKPMCVEPAWSPDGKRIVFASNRDGDYEVYIMDADGKDLAKLTDNPAYDGYPNWGSAPIAVEPAGKLRSTWGKIKRSLISR